MGEWQLTAEIAIMNKNAIAIAADSAVTIGKGEKVFNSANKIFMLSKYHPVGIMVYNNAQFMGVPWETIIKLYRKGLDDTQFKTIREYGENFIHFLIKRNLQFSEYEEIYVKGVIENCFLEIRDKILQQVKESVNLLSRDLTEDEMEAIVDQQIRAFSANLEGINNLDSVKADSGDYILQHYGNIIVEIKSKVFGQLQIGSQTQIMLEKIVQYLFTKEIFSHAFSGIVICGFGEDEIFPALISYIIEGKIRDDVRYKVDQEQNITFQEDYAIIPFAQTDVVETFVTGIDHHYLNAINTYFNIHILNRIDHIPNLNLTPSQADAIKMELKEKWDEFVQAIVDYGQNKYLIPILKAIIVSPREELASMAESLVNLTSFKRQVSLDPNLGTVGGPIDVAVISKSDGFVWIKRKHYFSPDLNTHFFKNYYRD